MISKVCRTPSHCIQQQKLQEDAWRGSFWHKQACKNEGKHNKPCPIETLKVHDAIKATSRNNQHFGL